MGDPRDDAVRRLLGGVGVHAEPLSVAAMTGRGFTDEVSSVELDDGRRLVLRRWAQPRAVEFPRAMLLSDHGVPAPRLVAADEFGSLVEFAPGRLLGDLIEDGRDDATAWFAVGRAYRAVHDVEFPPRIVGRVEPDRVVLEPGDPAEAAHETLTAATPGLRRRRPELAGHVPAIHTRVDRCAEALRTASTSLCHGDVNMWNVLVDGDAVTLIDWDLAEIGDPAMEVGLLDKHASLFTGRGLPSAFFAGYGPRVEPRTTLHRIVSTVGWVGSDDWEQFASDPSLPAEQRARAAGWLETLLGYLHTLPDQLDRLDHLIDTAEASEPEHRE